MTTHNRQTGAAIARILHTLTKHAHLHLYESGSILRLGCVMCITVLPSATLADPTLHYNETSFVENICNVIDESGKPVSEKSCREILEVGAEAHTRDVIAQILVLHKPYKDRGIVEGAPTRETASVKVPINETVLDRLNAFIQYETSVVSVNWSLVKPALTFLGASQNHTETVVSCQRLISVPLGQGDNSEQIQCVLDAIALLAQQASEVALDTLLKCTEVGFREYQDVFPNSPGLRNSDGGPSLLSWKIASYAAATVSVSAPDGETIAFFAKVEENAVHDERHPLHTSIAVYVREAEQIEKNGTTSPGPVPDEVSQILVLEP